MDIKCACGRRLDINRLGKEYISCTCGDSYLFCIVFECRKTTWSTNTVRRQDTCREQIIYESAPNSKITIFPSIDLDKKEKLYPIFPQLKYSREAIEFFDKYKLNERNSINRVYRSNIPETSWDLLIARIAIQLYTLKRVKSRRYVNTTLQEFAERDTIFRQSLKAFHYYQDVAQNNKRGALNKFIKELDCNGIISFKNGCEKAQIWEMAKNINLPEKGSF